MLPLPESNWRNQEVLATWAELSALAVDNGAVFRGALRETLRDSQLFADASARRGDERDSTSPDTADSVTNETWRALARRSRLLEHAWPLRLVGDTLVRAPERATLKHAAAYTTMLLLDACGSQWYRTLRIESGDKIRTWFESIVEISLSQHSGGRTTRFGAPFPNGWPTMFPDRVKHLAGLFGLDARMADITRLAGPQQQDDSLDVVARWKIGDEEDGCPYLLVQCATGANWSSHKQGQPTMQLWNRYIAWNGPQFKCLAVPFALRGQGQLERACFDHFSAIVFDRIRIAASVPDASLDDSLRANLVTWCQAKLAEIPTD